MAYQTKVPAIGTVDELQKCREWGVTPQFLQVLRLIYKQGLRISKASKVCKYNIAYTRAKLRELRRKGLEEEIISTLQVNDPLKAKARIKFWESMEALLEQKDRVIMRPYAEIEGLVNQRQPISQQTNVQVNTFMLDKKLGDKEKEDE